MDSLQLLSFILLLFIAVSSFQQSTASQMQSVPDLERCMYASIDGNPCVRLLNLTGEIVCANPGRHKVTAPITRFKSSHDLVLTRPSAVLVKLSEFNSLVAKMESDMSFSRNVAGVLVEAGGVNSSIGFSPDEKFPLAEFAALVGGEISEKDRKRPEIRIFGLWSVFNFKKIEPDPNRIFRFRIDFHKNPTRTDPSPALPESYNDAMSNADVGKWKASMHEGRVLAQLVATTLRLLMQLELNPSLTH